MDWRHQTNGLDWRIHGLEIPGHSMKKYFPQKLNYLVLINNYLVLEVIKHHLSVIHTTAIILAAHLTWKDGNHAGSSNIEKNTTSTLNGNTHNQHSWETSRPQSYSTCDEKRNIVVGKRWLYIHEMISICIGIQIKYHKICCVYFARNTFW